MSGLNKISGLFLLLYLVHSPWASCFAAPIGNENSDTVISSNQADSSTRLNSGIQFQQMTQEPNWWLQFQDPLLNQYIQDALKYNRELKVSLLRIKEAEARTQLVGASRYPTVNVGLDYARQHNSQNFTSFSSAQLVQSPSPFALMPAQTFNIYQVPVTASYEPDFWAKNRQRIEAQQKETEVQRYASLGVITSITTEIATVYFKLAKNNQLLKLETQNQQLGQDTLALENARFKAGLSSYDQVNHAKSDLNETTTRLSQYQKQQSLLSHQLAVLCGKSPQEMPSMTSEANIDRITLPDEPPISIPSERALRRPDILEAEARMAQSQLNVSIARKAFFPTISLTGQFGLSSNALANWLNWKSHAYMAGTKLIQTLVDGGKKKADLKIARLQAEQSMENYQQTIIKALQEVEDNLALLKHQQLDFATQRQLVHLAADTAQLSRARQHQGLTTSLEVNEAQRKLIVAEKAQVASKGEYLTAILGLTKALGGGVLN